MLTVEQAWELIADAVSHGPCVRLPLGQAQGLRLAESIDSPLDSPPFDKSMMDGFAVRVADIRSGLQRLPVTAEIQAGSLPPRPLGAGETFRILTGAMIPSGCDAVVPLEWTRTCSETGSDPEEIEIGQTERIQPGLNLILRGRSMRQGTRIAGSGDRLRPASIAVLAECGIVQPLVHRRPRVAVLSTGNELVEIDQTPAPGQIRNSNAAMLCAQIESAGGEPVPLGIAPDHPERLREKISAGLECDFLCLSGGVSVGKFDLIPQVLADCQVHEVFHRVAMKPGKPCWFGIKPDSETASRCHVFGLPGNPVSSLVSFELFVRFAISRFLGGDLPRPKLVPARLTAAMTHRSDRPTWHPACLHQAEGELRVAPVAWQGSFDLSGVATGNCSLQLPAGESSWPAGAWVQVLPWESLTAF